MSTAIQKNLQVLVYNAKANFQGVKDRPHVCPDGREPDKGIVTSIAMYKETLDKLSEE